MPRLELLPILLLATLTLAPAAHAANLVSNGEFDENVVGWSTPSSTVEGVWASLDVDDSEASGSELVTSVEPGLRISVGVVQCISFEAGQTLEFSGAIYVPSGQSEAASVGYIMDWQAGAACSSGRVGLIGINPESEVFDEWQWLEESLEPPEGAESVVIIGRINFAAKNDPNGAFDAYFDAIELPEPGHSALVALGVVGWLVRGRREMKMDSALFASS